MEAVGAAQCADWQEEASGRSDPSGAIQSNAASRNNVLDVRMMLQVLSPSVGHAEKPDVCSQMLWVCGQYKQCRCTGSEQQIVKQSLILQG